MRKEGCSTVRYRTLVTASDRKSAQASSLKSLLFREGDVVGLHEAVFDSPSDRILLAVPRLKVATWLRRGRRARGGVACRQEADFSISATSGAIFKLS